MLRQQIGEYCERLRDLLRNVGALSYHEQDTPGPRAQLYVNRRLFHEIGEQQDREKGDEPDKLQMRVVQDKRRVTQQESELLRELRRGQAARRVISADAGMGKTSLLENLAWHLADEFLQNPGQARRIPVLVSLVDWKLPAPLRDLVGEALGDELLDALQGKGEIVLLLDGLDEVGSEKDIDRICAALDSGLRDDFRNCPCLLAGRPWAFERATFRWAEPERRELEELNQSQVKDYIINYFSVRDRTERQGRQLCSQYDKIAGPAQKLMRTPLLLMLTCLINERGMDVHWPVTESELMEKAIRELLTRRGLP